MKLRTSKINLFFRKMTEPESETTSDLFNFNTKPINSYNPATDFGKLPETLKLQTFDSYLPDLNILLKIEKDSESRAEIFRREPKPDKNLPKPIDFDNVEDPRTLSMSKTALLKKKKAENKREGAPLRGWYGLGRPEITEELENDLKILKLRGALDPKRFYKKDADKSKIQKRCDFLKKLTSNFSFCFIFNIFFYPKTLPLEPSSTYLWIEPPV